MSQVLIPPTVGRVVWFYPDSNSAEAGFHRHADGGGPYAALIAHVWTDHMVNLSVIDANGNLHSRTSVPLLHGDDAVDSAFCIWMPFQKGQAKVNTGLAPAPDAAIRNVLYGAIRSAMDELAALHPGFNAHVNRAWNHLHTAFWSESPAPASAPGLRDTLALEETRIELSSLSAGATIDVLVSEPGEEERLTSYRVEPSSDSAGHDLMVRTLAVACGLPVDGDSLTFGAALEQVKTGARVARAGWNGKGQFVYLVPPAAYAVQTGAAKAHFGEGAMVPYNAYLALKTVDDAVSTWAPSVSDCLAEDWVVVQ